MEDGENNSRARSLPDFVPDFGKDALVSWYYRYLSWKANRSRQPRVETVERRSDAPNHVVVLVVDALRPDFEPDLPMEFGRAVTPGTWTFPAVTSIQTGLYPHEHEAVAHTHPDDESYVLPEQATPDLTLPDVFAAAGYDTYADLAFMTPFLALGGWYRSHRVRPDVDVRRVVGGYRKWRSGRERTFSYLHLGDLHAPIEPPQEYVRRHDVDTSIDELSRLVRYTDDYDGSPACLRFREERLKLYRAALDHVEDVLGSFFDDYGDDTLILLTGDHGEAHWEQYELDYQFTDSRPNYGVGHGGTPFDMVARVPVGVHTPDESFAPRGGHASLCDIPSTVCSEVLATDPFSGRSWRDRIPETRTVVCEATRYGAERKAVYRGDSKVIRGETDDVTLTARLDDAAGESFDESLSDDVIDDLLDAVPDYWTDGRINSNASRIVEDRLSALGYR